MLTQEFIIVPYAAEIRVEREWNSHGKVESQKIIKASQTFEEKTIQFHTVLYRLKRVHLRLCCWSFFNVTSSISFMCPLCSVFHTNRTRLSLIGLYLLACSFGSINIPFLFWLHPGRDFQ